MTASAATTEAPRGRERRRGGTPSRLWRAWSSTHTTALFGPECQSFVDNLLAKIRAWRSSNNQQRVDRRLLPLPRFAGVQRIERRADVSRPRPDVERKL